MHAVSDVQRNEIKKNRQGPDPGTVNDPLTFVPRHQKPTTKA